jgi:hypothetical protein
MAELREGSEDQQDYLSFLLRLWRVEGTGKGVWRAALKSSHTGKQIGFGSLEDLFDFLRARAGTDP